MYVVLNATQPVQALTQHFDNLIRAADVNLHEAAAFARNWLTCRSHRLCLIDGNVSFEREMVEGVAAISRLE